MGFRKHIKYWTSFVIIWLLVVLIQLYVSENANGFFTIVLNLIFSWAFMSYIDDILTNRSLRKKVD